MITEVLQDFTITYPEALCFAFNKNIVTCTGVALPSVTFDIEGYKDTRLPINGVIKVDISPYLQMLFSSAGSNSELVQGKEIKVKVSSGEIGLKEFTTYVIWGVVGIGDILNEPKDFVWWVNFPQTISMIRQYGDRVKVRKDNETEFAQYGSEETLDYELVHLDLAHVLAGATSEAEIRLDGEGEAQSTFAVQFDETFEQTEDRLLHRVELDDSQHGIFLRWIDRHGFYQYQLFDSAKDTISAKDFGEFIPSADEMLSMYDGVGRVQGKETTRSVTLIAPLADISTREKLSTILTSPLVDMYVGKHGVEWMPVNIQGKYTHEDVSLADFEVQMNFPNVISQRL